MSFVLGFISFSAVVALLVLAYQNEGATQGNGLSAAVAAFFGLVGLVLGIVSECHAEVYHFFPRVGIVLNTLTLLCLTGILYFGGAFT